MAAQAEVVESGQVRAPGHESPFCTFRGGNIWSVGGSSSGLHKRPQKGPLQSHWRAPQPRILPAKNLGGGAERQRCCSSWGNGEEAGWVGETLIDLTHACILLCISFIIL